MRTFSRAASLLTLVVGAALVSAAVASAGTQTLISGNGTVGGADAQITFSTELAPAWVPARIVIPHPRWAMIAGTQWVAPAQEPDPVGGGIGPSNTPVHYRIPFTLPALFLAPSLTVDVYSDNIATVFLNGTSIGAQPGNDWLVPPEGNFGWSGTGTTVPPTTIATADAALFHPGANYLSFDTIDRGNPQGLDFRAVVTYTEPSGETCRKDGWRAFGVFKNQGDCVSYGATHTRNPPAYGQG